MNSEDNSMGTRNCPAAHLHLNEDVVVDFDVDVDLDVKADHPAQHELSQARLLPGRRPFLSDCSRHSRQPAAALRGYGRSTAPCIPLQFAEHCRGLGKEHGSGPATVLCEGARQRDGMRRNPGCLHRPGAHRRASSRGSRPTAYLGRKDAFENVPSVGTVRSTTRASTTSAFMSTTTFRSLGKSGRSLN